MAAIKLNIKLTRLRNGKENTMEDNLINWQHTYKALEEYGAAVRNRYQDKIILNDHLASGNLLNTLEYIVTFGSTKISVTLNLQDYWKYLEEGTKPHWPPINAILDWITAKPVLPSKTFDGKLPTMKQLAFLISRKISEEGTEPTHMLEETIDEINAEFEDRIEQAILQDLDEGINAIIIRGFVS